ncbi:MAG: polysaccharide biosynthesis tyrosine autokinase, partial [Fibrobacter sp.]|nr:polysaccharide biosynthesis tyrosine autokinase [Fibrobacter sp.]
FPKFTNEDAALFVQANLSLKKTTYTSFLSLSARAKSKMLAYRIADVATTVFKSQCKTVESEDAIRTLAEIDNQLHIVRKTLEEAEHDYRSFSEKSGRIEEGVTPELRALQEAYSKELAQIGLEKANLDAEKKQLAKIESNIAPVGKQKSSEFLNLRTKLSELEKEKVRLEKLGIRLSGISTLDKEIREIENKLLDFKQSPNVTSDPAIIRQWQNLRMSVVAKEAELQLSHNKLDSYQKEINLYKKNNPDILSNSLELLRLKRSKEVYENLYTILLERAEEERIRNASHSAGIKIVDLPQIPNLPISKNEKQIYIAGLILGLIFGLALAFVIEFNDTTIKSGNDIERYIDLSVLGIIPHNNKDKSIEVTNINHHGSSKSLLYSPLSNFDDDDSIVTEAYRSLRTNISFVSPDKPLRTIALTSSCPSEGKTVTTANLALAYAQMGKRTLLIDTDLRRPTLHHFFYKKREPGFSDLFGESQDYDSVIKTTQSKNLSIITAGIPTPNPAEIIGSNKITQLLEYYKSKYDIVIFDTPPIIAVTDAALLGTKVDGLFFVIRSHHTDREIVLRAV